MDSNLSQSESTDLLREKIRNYARQQRKKTHSAHSDSLRFGLGEIQDKIRELTNLDERDVSGLATRIKRRKHATVEDMYRLSHAFLQGVENIRAFAKIPGALRVLVKELTGHDAERQVGAAECFCNLSLGEPPVCEKIAAMAGSYLVTYLDSTEERLKRTALWTLANILATAGKGAQTLMQMALVAKLWHLYTADVNNADASSDYRADAAICLQLISLHSKQLLRPEDLSFMRANFQLKSATCPASEYHLQIVFHCELVSDNVEQNDVEASNLRYLVNFALSNLCSTHDLVDNASRLRVLYAVRVLANLLAASRQPHVFQLLLQLSSSVYQTSLAQVLNKLFGFRDAGLTRETFWLLRNFLQQQELEDSGDFLAKLQVPRATELQLKATADFELRKLGDISRLREN